VFYECEFSRVPINYWENIDRVKERFEWKLAQEGLEIKDIPSIISNKILIQWGFSNPLKRHGFSPFRLLNKLYPDQFKETDFKKVPHHYYENTSKLKKQFLKMIDKEQIPFNEIPKKVNQEMLFNHGFSTSLNSFSNSPSKFISSLFPNDFSINDHAIKPNGYWKDLSHARRAIEELLASVYKGEDELPKFLTKK
jgi:hypothetical protein